MKNESLNPIEKAQSEKEIEKNIIQAESLLLDFQDMINKKIYISSL